MREMKKIFFSLLILLHVAIPFSFAETLIKAEVDKQSISTDEALSYKVTITAAQNKLPQPKLPKFDGFTVLSSANQSSVTVRGGQMNSTLVYIFMLAAQSAGQLKIEPATIEVQGKTYSSDAFEIQVKQGKSIIPKQPPRQRPGAPKQIPLPDKESEEPKTTL